MELMILLLTIITACICLYYYVLHKMSYFERLKIPYSRPLPILGNIISIIFQRKTLQKKIQELYNNFPDVKYFGFYEFTKTVYILCDPELINSVTIKNFDHFCDHDKFINEELNPIAAKNLFGLKGDHWREMRKILSPSFTSSKMKIMFQLIQQCAENFSASLAAQSKNSKEYEMKDMLSRYATDVVATCAFGINLDSIKNPNNDFFLIAKKALNFDAKMTFKFIMNRRFPMLSKLLGIKMFSDQVQHFFKEIISDTVKLRKEKGIKRPDMIQLLLESLGEDNQLTNIDELTAQAFVFFLAGFESVSTCMSFLVHEVGINPDIQRKLQAEIDDTIKQTNGKPTYEIITRLKYLDAVLNETLRLYPISGFIDRVCVKNFELPPATSNSQPVMLTPGDYVWIASGCLHLDPKYFPDPHKFDPNRFLENKVDNSVYMPFGNGPRICIGNRFALMEAKVMMFYLLSRCDLEPASKTKIPIVLSNKTIHITSEGGFWMKLRTRKVTAFVKE